MKIVRLRSMIVAVTVAWMPIFSAELPIHYLSGNVCLTEFEVPFHRAGYPCMQPLPGVRITAHTSQGDTVVTISDQHGAYSLRRMALSGTDEDYVMFTCPDCAALKVSRLRYWGDLDPLLGATVFLRKNPTPTSRPGGVNSSARGDSK